MLVLVSGGCKNGKSNLAQDICVKISCNKDRYYLATLKARDQEDLNRIRLHVKNREKLNFKTLELFHGLNDISEKNICLSSVFLLDSLTMLLANRMFVFDGKDFSFLPEEGKKLLEEIKNFAEKVYALVIVSDTIYCDSFDYSKESQCYRFALAALEKEIVKNADIYIEMLAGKKLIHKGENIFTDIFKRDIMKEDKKKYTLIFGGAFQGKTDYVKKTFNLSEKDIYKCSREEKTQPDFSFPCISHLENYLYWSLKNNVEPFSDFKEGSILIFTDIFCGLVPVDKFERQWREKCGLYLQELSKKSSLVRVTCGIGERLL